MLKNKKKIISIYLLKNIFEKIIVRNNIITSIVASTPQQVNDNFFFKCKNV